MRIENFSARAVRALAYLYICVVAAGCQARRQTTFEGFALGTIYSVTVVGDVPGGLQERVEAMLEQAEGSMSIFKPGSLLSRLNRNETDSLDVHIARCIEIAWRVSRMSDGAYDITILPLVEAYGFATRDADFRVNIDSLVQLVGYQMISIRDGRLVKARPEVRIDLNSIAKGYIVDMVGELLAGEGLTDWLVNIGGEIYCRGTNAHGKAWVVGIETPVEGSFVEGARTECRIAVSGVGVATSGNYRNFTTDDQGHRMTHIIDPRNGRATTSALLSATVIAPTCAEADALGTMFIALGLDGAHRFMEAHPEIPVLLIVAGANGMEIERSTSMKSYALN